MITVADIDPSAGASLSEEENLNRTAPTPLIEEEPSAVPVNPSKPLPTDPPSTTTQPQTTTQQQVSFERFEPEDRPSTTYGNTIAEIIILFGVVSMVVAVTIAVREFRPKENGQEKS